MAPDVRDVLAQFDDVADDIEAMGGRTSLPDGKYQVEVAEPSSGILLAEDSDGATRARIILRVLVANDDSIVGKSVSKSWTLVDANGVLNEVGIGFFKGDLETMGVEWTKLSDAAELLESALGAIVAVEAKTVEKKDGTYHNVYINDLVQPASAGASF